MSMQSFDPAVYKSTTKGQWDTVAEAWDEWDATLTAWLSAATSRMLDLAHVGTGGTVLDVAAGAGGQTLDAARRVGPSGQVVATDISTTILEYAQRRATAAGLTNVATAELDGENLDVQPAHFDAVISRLGVVYFPDRAAFYAGARQALKRGGRIGLIVYGPADRNGFFSVPVGIIRAAAELPPPAPGQPGPFCLGGDGVLAAELASAGFTDIVVEPVDAPLRLSSAAGCLRFAQESFGALHQMLSGLPKARQAQVWDEVGSALRQFETADGFVGPCQLLVAAASA
jgi:SAM-dependent methyltransferase